MKTNLFGLLLAAAALASGQGIVCKASMGSSTTMRDLYGSKVSLIQGRVNCFNNGPSASAISGVAIDISLPGLNTIPASTASAMLAKAYNHQPGERSSRELGAALGAVGILEAARYGSIGAGPLGLIAAAAVGVQQYLIPALKAGEAPLDLTNQCDSFPSTPLAVGGEFTCTFYVKKPVKGDPAISSSFDFAINTAPAIGPQPEPPPLQLQNPTADLAEPSDDVRAARLAKIMAAHELALAAAEAASRTVLISQDSPATLPGHVERRAAFIR